MSIQVISVESRREKRDFLNFPWKIYQTNPHWIPPLRTNQKQLAGFAKHPFYETAESQAFLATDGIKIIGRILAIHDRAHNQYHNENRGFFGFFECEDHSEAAKQLFDAARQWLGEKGATAIRGPVNPSMNYECGLLIDSFDKSPCFMMTYNQPYYEKLILENGYQKAHDLLAFWGHVDMLATLDKKLTFIAEETISRFQVKIRPIDLKEFRRDIKIFLDVYNRAMPGNWGFVPLSESEIEHTAKELKHLIAPELTSIAEIDGKPIGAQFGLLDYNPRIRKIDGKLFPFGFMRLLANKRKIKKLRFISTNVVPEYQKWGIGLALLSRLVPEFLEWGMKEAELSWVLETNKLSRGTIERAGAILEKTYRLYDCELEPKPDCQKQIDAQESH
ncbi:MAG: N-acetyltransferase [Planctomycetota bacterium]|nr:N-acetyltransferase [Planctomycetota bacterium]